MASLAEVRQQQDASNAAQTELIKQMLLREERGRLYYCSQPAAGLPNFIIIFWQRDPGQKAILYLNDGETQARNAREYYFQTYDTVEQAKAAEIAPGTFSKLVDFAEGRDSSYTIAIWGSLLLIGGALGFVGRLTRIWVIEIPGASAGFFGSAMYFVILGLAALRLPTAIVAVALVACMMALLGRRYIELQILTSEPGHVRFREKVRQILQRRTADTVSKHH
mgnify:CR=1 FL=1